MENGSKKVGLRMAAGVLVAITIIVAVFASGVTFPSLENNPSLGSEQGRLTILLMDAPVDVDELWINVTGVAVHRVGNKSVQAEVQENELADDDQGGWISISLSGADPNELYFDLLKYRNDTGGNSVVLNIAEGDTAEGTYNKVRITVDNATAIYYEYNEEELFKREVDLKVPSNSIDVITKFTIEEQNPVVVLIDMQPDWVAISNSGNLRPVMKAKVYPEKFPENTQIETIETPGE